MAEAGKERERAAPFIKSLLGVVIIYVKWWKMTATQKFLASLWFMVADCLTRQETEEVEVCPCT